MTTDDAGDRMQAALLRTAEGRWHLEVSRPGDSEATLIAEGDLNGPLTPDSRQQLQHDAASRLMHAGYTPSTGNTGWEWAGEEPSSTKLVTENRWAMQVLSPGASPSEPTDSEQDIEDTTGPAPADTSEGPPPATDEEDATGASASGSDEPAAPSDDNQEDALGASATSTGEQLLAPADGEEEDATGAPRSHAGEQPGTAD